MKLEDSPVTLLITNVCLAVQIHRGNDLEQAIASTTKSREADTCCEESMVTNSDCQLD